MKKSIKAIIEEKLDGDGDEMTRELTALIALHSRKCLAQNKVDNFIKEFAESLEIKKYWDVVITILDYLYPANRECWKLQDERYLKIVKNSAWLKANKNS
jgi:hypothetical protein